MRLLVHPDKFSIEIVLSVFGQNQFEAQDTRLLRVHDNRSSRKRRLCSRLDQWLARTRRGIKLATKRRLEMDNITSTIPLQNAKKDPRKIKASSFRGAERAGE
jgi:hypothetical protein